MDVNFIYWLFSIFVWAFNEVIFEYSMKIELKWEAHQRIFQLLGGKLLAILVKNYRVIIKDFIAFGLMTNGG